jgi:hypothetical protein
MLNVWPEVCWHMIVNILMVGAGKASKAVVINKKAVNLRV